VTEPQLAASLSAHPFIRSADAASDEKAVTRKCSVLLIEDQLETVTSIFTALDPATHEIEIASADTAAAALIDDRAIDLVLLSLSNPDGIRTLIELKRGTDTPVVALVGGGDYFQLNYQLRMATAAGANGVVVKPIASERLRIVLDQALRMEAVRLIRNSAH
jgi:DNA-binding response OmpR family regulator